MPVPSTIDELSTTASSNSPAGSESPINTDNYFRAHAAFIAQLRDNRLARDGSVVPTANLPMGGYKITGLLGGSANGEAVAHQQVVLRANRANWATVGVNNLVTGFIPWMNYGNGFSIIDASSGTAPGEVVSISQTDAVSPWASSYPMLVGYDGTTTYGVRVDSARAADNAPGRLGLAYIARSALLGAVITNGTGYPWHVVFDFTSQGPGTSTCEANVSGVIAAIAVANTPSGGAGGATMSFLVPPGGTYSVTNTFGAAPTVLSWKELR